MQSNINSIETVDVIYYKCKTKCSIFTAIEKASKQQVNRSWNKLQWNILQRSLIFHSSIIVRITDTITRDAKGKYYTNYTSKLDVCKALHIYKI